MGFESMIFLLQEQPLSIKAAHKTAETAFKDFFIALPPIFVDDTIIQKICGWVKGIYSDNPPLYQKMNRQSLTSCLAKSILLFGE